MLDPKKANPLQDMRARARAIAKASGIGRAPAKDRRRPTASNTTDEKDEKERVELFDDVPAS